MALGAGLALEVPGLARFGALFGALATGAALAQNLRLGRRMAEVVHCVAGDLGLVEVARRRSVAGRAPGTGT